MSKTKINLKQLQKRMLERIAKNHKAGSGIAIPKANSQDINDWGESSLWTYWV